MSGQNQSTGGCACARLGGGLRWISERAVACGAFERHRSHAPERRLRERDIRHRSGAGALRAILWPAGDPGRERSGGSGGMDLRAVGIPTIFENLFRCHRWELPTIFENRSFPGSGTSYYL
jgi:hypothetical protein